MHGLTSFSSLRLFGCAAAVLATSCDRLEAQSPILTKSTTPVFGAGTLVVDAMSRMDALLDADLDGNMDAIGFFTSKSNRTQGELRWFEGDGRGGMTEHSLLTGVPIGADNPTPDIVLGDWDGDGHRDFALYELGGKLHYFHARTAGPTQARSVQLPLSHGITGVVAADFNADGRDDLAVLTGLTCHVFLNSSGVPDTLGHTRPFGGDSLRLIDVDQDGALDLMHIGTAKDVHLLKIHRKTPWTGVRQDAVTVHASIVLGNTLRAMPACGDLDGDGDDDVVVFFGNGQYRILRQDPVAKFTLEAWATGGPATVLADIDGDGDLDGICCGSGGGTPGGTQNTAAVRFEFCINQGGGVFAPSHTAPNMGARHIAGAADMNSDGRIDLVAGRGILFNRVGFADPFAQWIRPSNMAYVNVDRVADVDGDGDIEVHTPFVTQGYRNPGDGHLQWAPPNLPGAPAGTYFNTNVHYRGDWDGDGDEDILLGTTSTSGPLLGLTLLRNQDGAKYVDAGLVSPKGDSFHPFYKSRPVLADYFAVDLNHDGLTDLVTSSTSTTPTRAFINQGGSRFIEISHGLHTTLRFARDLDGDGYPELVARHFSGAIEIYRGRKDGVPGAPDVLDVGAPIGEFDLADHDDDGDLDVYATVGKEVALFLNQGSGFTKTVLWQRDYATSTTLRLVDLDGDGRRDLYVFPASHKTTAWVAVRDAAGGFAWMEQMMIGGTTALFDADGDGDVDLVGDFFQANLTFHGASRGITRQFGIATTGTNGVQPLLSATGPFRPGEASALHLRNGIGGTFAMIVAGTNEVHLPDFPWRDVNTYVWPQPFQTVLGLGGAAGVAAAGSVSVGMKLPAGVAGATIFYHAYLLDPTAPLGIISSNAVRVRYGN